MPISAVNKCDDRTYYLHSFLRRLPNGTTVHRYFFNSTPVGALEEVPEGYTVSESMRNGMPMLRKKY